MWAYLRSKSTVEAMAIAFTMLVIFIILAATLYVVISEIRDPTTDTSQIVDGLSTVIAAILGALLGLLAGKADSMNGKSPDPTPRKPRPTKKPPV